MCGGCFVCTVYTAWTCKICGGTDLLLLLLLLLLLQDPARRVLRPGLPLPAGVPAAARGRGAGRAGVDHARGEVRRLPGWQPRTFKSF